MNSNPFTCLLCGYHTEYGNAKRNQLHHTVSHSGGTPIEEVRNTNSEGVPRGLPEWMGLTPNRDIRQTPEWVAEYKRQQEVSA